MANEKDNLNISSIIKLILIKKKIIIYLIRNIMTVILAVPIAYYLGIVFFTLGISDNNPSFIGAFKENLSLINIDGIKYSINHGIMFAELYLIVISFAFILKKFKTNNPTANNDKALFVRISKKSIRGFFAIILGISIPVIGILVIIWGIPIYLASVMILIWMFVKGFYLIHIVFFVSTAFTLALLMRSR
ncbi:MAG: hypothetical protein DKM50_08455 [Candidatus Margulisiibacteriota bacterium]|nr:MAG: hypothetical protein A2X43_11995 [Candidatus Margulisbacteria bacterium GWD2_39_127]OGI01861.1 MAG: hypothetical protein A2X42_04520 [Candidatus Margulisbacteria bacterium GWF2_38_17]OGI10183.1 MAG: hypothetical protein A2X41_01240 [Candidatus Margulisbacteria bacterium GWE2_39_32]PZM79481.1 MAG: hypothetical protein DKM50_08455 [Candidatus Margulisiibacteriota bacterium]HAR63849.1 hypothetical protein [Candidatus Margulisiibacteriota bacterium]